MKYDFILFENLYEVENHYKDLALLAELLKEAGYTVAIADVFKESKLCNVEGIPHIKIAKKSIKRFNEPRTFSKKENGFISLFWRIRKDLYIINALRELHGMASNIYLGSMTMATPYFFFKYFKKDTKYFMWALRSAHSLYWKKSNKFSLTYWLSKNLYNNIRRKDNLYLVLSNELIKKEYEEKINANSNRIIVRPERTISTLPRISSSTPGKLKLLTIGTLRPFKHVEFCLDALRELNNPQIEYVIAGRCKYENGYEEMIREHMEGVPNVTRINRFIPDDEYEQLMNDCDCLMMCDGTQASCASNGTMSEALLHGKPIIAPNFDPFKYEVETYDVGYLYEYAQIDSLKKLLLSVVNIGTREKEINLQKYANKYLRNIVAEDLKNNINKLL